MYHIHIATTKGSYYQKPFVLMHGKTACAMVTSTVDQRMCETVFVNEVERSQFNEYILGQGLDEKKYLLGLITKAILEAEDKRFKRLCRNGTVYRKKSDPMGEWRILKVPFNTLTKRLLGTEDVIYLNELIEDNPRAWAIEG